MLGPTARRPTRQRPPAQSILHGRCAARLNVEGHPDLRSGSCYTGRRDDVEVLLTIAVLVDVVVLHLSGVGVNSSVAIITVTLVWREGVTVAVEKRAAPSQPSIAVLIDAVVIYF